MKTSIIKDFSKYVSLNILGMIALSCYILADTFFIAKALGATGIAALNFSIPVYSLINGVGLMIGIGGATRFSILKSREEDQAANKVFSISIKLGIIIGIIYVLLGLFGSRTLALLLGSDAATINLTNMYMKTILCFAPFFIANNISLAFVRNDNNPNLSMVAMLIGSFSNIVLDYVFMFPLGMGMYGAAFATGIAPIISLCILLIHFIKKTNTFIYVKNKIKLSVVTDICSLGLSTFITEMSSGIALIAFNYVILGLRGNIGVAAYGIVANIAFVVVCIFSGVAQGAQPLISKYYGLEDYHLTKKVLKYSVTTSIAIGIIVYGVMFMNTDFMVSMFNSENNMEIAEIAKMGLRIYFIGFIFVGINIAMATYLSATENPRYAFIISIARGCVLIVPLVILLSKIWDMSGVWMSFVMTEFIVTTVVVYLGTIKRKA